MTDAESVVTFDKMCHWYGSRAGATFTLGPLSLRLGTVGVTALLGPNGAGKSTLIRLMSGDIAPRLGELTVNGSVEYLPQNTALPARMRVEDALGYLGGLKGVTGRLLRERMGQAMEATGVSAYARSTYGSLSGGQARRVLVSTALLTRPDVLLLDEPSSGLDIDQRDDLTESLRAVAERTRVVVSTHNVDDLVAVSDDVLLLADGQMRFFGSVRGFVDAGVDTAATTAAPARAEDWKTAYRRLLRADEVSEP